PCLLQLGTTTSGDQRQETYRYGHPKQQIKIPDSVTELRNPYNCEQKRCFRVRDCNGYRP
ncbi:MAG: hypothetical protein JWQ85_1927, partial [Mucilaginibacter sp.]|nr:hypothetical protein [Mucilaginibacter sp.]